MTTASSKALIQPLKDIGNLDESCPNCSKLLAKRPERKTKCPHCGQFIFVRTRPTDRRRVLVTESGAAEIEAQWTEIASVPPLRIYPKDGFKEEEARLAEKFGRKPTDNDVVWSLLNKELMEHARNGHWGLYRNTIFEIGEVLRSEAKWMQALRKYFEVCYLDINDPRNVGNIGLQEGAFIKAVLGDETSAFRHVTGELYPGMLARVEYLLRSLEIDESAAHDLFLEAARGLKDALVLPMSPENAWDRLSKEIYDTNKPA